MSVTPASTRSPAERHDGAARSRPADRWRLVAALVATSLTLTGPAAAIGIPFEHICIVATHTHSGLWYKIEDYAVRESADKQTEDDRTSHIGLLVERMTSYQPINSRLAPGSSEKLFEKMLAMLDAVAQDR